VVTTHETGCRTNGDESKLYDEILPNSSNIEFIHVAYFVAAAAAVSRPFK